MCGIIGVSQTTNIEKKFVEDLLLQTSIRGTHATGVSKIKDGKIETLKLPISAKEFVTTPEWGEFSTELGNIIIGHCRYSTSDIRYNMPLTLGDFSLVHNGVITQEDFSHWKKDEHPYETHNDSELLLHDLAYNTDNLKHYPLASYAYLLLYKINNKFEIKAVRNGLRPLYQYKDNDKCVYSSTEDILKRVGLNNEYITAIPACSDEPKDIQVEIGYKYESRTNI